MTSVPAGIEVAPVAHAWRVLAVAVGLGIAAQGLFWGAGIGLNAPILAGLLLTAVVWAARSRGVAMTAGTAAVAGVAGAFSLALAVRAEPLTTVVNALLVVGALAVLVHAYPSERWLRYGLRDWLVAALQLAGHHVTGPPGLVLAASRQRAAGRGADPAWRWAMPVMRGITIAVPVVALFAALLASADAIFARGVHAAGDLLRLPPLDEAAGRALLTLVVSWVVAAGLWHQLRRPETRVLADQRVPRVLGFAEAAVVLVAVDLLFGVFVAIQARYFFGGHAAVVAEGLTYAEYARRGFGELVVVAVASLGLHLALAGLTRRDGRAQRAVFSTLTSALTVLVLVILASSFGRLLLYEEAFGFTRARTVAHVFMVWLGVLLVGLMVLEVADRVRVFLLAALVAAVGFAATLNVVGVDAFIVRRNLAHAHTSGELDTTYLASLSPDAAPALAASLDTADGPRAEALRDALGCVSARAVVGDWRSLRFADLRARHAVQDTPVSAGDPTACRRR